MQAKLGASFLVVALLYLLVGLAVPLLGLQPFAAIALTASTYVVLGLAAAWTISRMLSRRLNRLARAAARVSQGDLTLRISDAGADETAELAHSLSIMTESLLKIVLEVRRTADEINDSARSLSSSSVETVEAGRGIAATAREIARGAEDQAVQVQRTTETTRDLSEMVERVALRAREFYAVAAAAAEGAARGAADARRTHEAISQLTGRTASATAAVEGFRLKATEIGNIVSSITSISHQTHLLAINAAIEAARAGNEGRGFGVVAEEVSRLADNVRQFAEQISSISDEILEGSRAVAEEIGRSVAAADGLREMVDRSVASFEEIVSATHGTAVRVGEISELTDRQNHAARDVTRSLEAITRIARQNASGTEEASASAAEQTTTMQRMNQSVAALARTSHQLRELIAVFRVR